MDAQVEVHYRGGGVFRTPSDALVGPFADRAIRSLDADILFLGVHGMRPEVGLITPNQALVEMAQGIVVVADHTKPGVVALVKIALLPMVDTLITDDRASRDVVQEIEAAGVEVIMAGSQDEAREETPDVEPVIR